MRAGLAHSIRFDPANPGTSLSILPEAPAVFACARPILPPNPTSAKPRTYAAD
jgi:hypothetical protein